jgi:hypothetical protein
LISDEIKPKVENLNGTVSEGSFFTAVLASKGRKRGRHQPKLDSICVANPLAVFIAALVPVNVSDFGDFVDDSVSSTVPARWHVL